MLFYGHSWSVPLNIKNECASSDEMREMDGEILEAKVEETRVHALKHETLALVSLYSVHLWQ